MVSDSKGHAYKTKFQRQPITLVLGKCGMESGFVVVVPFDEVHFFCQQEDFLESDAGVEYLPVIPYNDTERTGQSFEHPCIAELYVHLWIIRLDALIDLERILQQAFLDFL